MIHTTPTPMRAFPPGPIANPGQGEHRGGASPCANAGALLRRRRNRRPCLRRTPLRSRMPTSRNGMRSGVSEDRCEEPRNWPRPDVHGRRCFSCCGHHLGRRLDDEPARRVRRGRNGACPDDGRAASSATERSAPWSCARSPAGCCFRCAGRNGRCAIMRSLGVLAVLVGSSIYQLVWLQTSVLH